MEDTEEERNEGQELAFLLEQRQRIAIARQDNLALQQTLTETVKQASQALADLNSVQELLDLADEISSHDKAQVSTVSNRPLSHACLPLVSGLERATSAAREISTLKQLILNSVWNKADDRCLAEAVLNQCRKLAAYQIRSDRTCRDPLSAVQLMNDEELAQLSLPEYLRPGRAGGSDEEGSDTANDESLTDASSKKKVSDPIDWEEVSLSLSTAPIASAHTAGACRTRWLMVVRPGLNQDSWRPEEIDLLKTTVKQQLDQTARVDWHIVADLIGGSRLPIDCLTAYQRLPFIVRSAPHLHLPENLEDRPFYDDEMLRLASIWGTHWALLAEKLNYNPSSITDKFDTALEGENEKRRWTKVETQRLLEGVRAQVELLDSPRPNRGRPKGSGKSKKADPSGLETPHPFPYQHSLLKAEDVDFEKLSRLLKTRTAKACKTRYSAFLASRSIATKAESASVSEWTPAEDSKLLKLRKAHPDWLWVEIARELAEDRENGRKITGTVAIRRWMKLKRLDEGAVEEILKNDANIRGARQRLKRKSILQMEEEGGGGGQAEEEEEEHESREFTPASDRTGETQDVRGHSRLQRSEAQELPAVREKPRLRRSGRSLAREKSDEQEAESFVRVVRHKPTRKR